MHARWSGGQVRHRQRTAVHHQQRRLQRLTDAVFDFKRETFSAKTTVRPNAASRLEWAFQVPHSIDSLDSDASLFDGEGLLADRGAVVGVCQRGSDHYTLIDRAKP